MSTAQQLTSHETGVAGEGEKGERVRKQLRGAAGKKKHRQAQDRNNQNRRRKVSGEDYVLCQLLLFYVLTAEM